MQPVTTIFLGPWGRMASCAWVVNLRRLHRLAIGAQVSNLPHMFFLLVLVANAQQVGQNAPASSAASTFQSSTQLVVETVSVKDKNGNAVENLTAKDFTVTEDGAPQTIRFFVYQKLAAEAPAPSASTARRATPFAKLPKSHITAESAGSTKYRDHRLLALYFD